MGGGAPPAHLKRVQVVVNAAARWATGQGRRTKVSKLMETTGWLTVIEQIKMSTTVQAWKMVHLGIPERPLERMTITPDKQIHVTHPRLQFSTECMRWRAARDWNELPYELRHTQTIAVFKRQTKIHILRQRPREPD